MIRNHFIPSSLDEALNLKNELGNRAVFLGGGTDLFINIWTKKMAPDYLIDLTKITEISDMEEIKGEHLILGAGLTVHHLSKSILVRKYIPALSEAAGQLGSPSIRNQATIGGNLVNSSPAADLIPPLIAQGAFAYTVGQTEKRCFPVEKLPIGVNKTLLMPEEILTRLGALGEDGGGQHHGLAVGGQHRTVGLTGHAAGFEGQRLAAPLNGLALDIEHFASFSSRGRIPNGGGQGRGSEILSRRSGDEDCCGTLGV